MKKYLFAAVTCCMLTHAFTQPAVRNEPRHHNVFENDFVRVLDVYLPPHDTTQYHVHATPSVFITFTKTATASQLAGQQPVKSISVAGFPSYDSLATPRIHRVWNEDSSWFHVMDVELTAGSAHTAEPVLNAASLKLLFDEPLVRGYNVQLTAKENLRLPSSKTGYLIISTNDALIALQSGNNLQHRLMKAGHYCWLDQETNISADGTVTLVLLQLR